MGNLDKKTVIILLGAPGTGKGTFANLITKQFGIPAISTGELLREEIKSGSKLGLELSSIVSSGSFVSDDVVVNMVQQRIRKPDCEKGFILDGFPRTIEQAKLLSNIVDVSSVILLDLDEDVLIQTICGRRSCSNANCNRGYNLANIQTPKIKMSPLAPKIENQCDDCQSPLLRRADDYEDVVKNRLKLYHNSTAPLIDFYEKLKKLHTFEVHQGKRDWPRFLPFFEQACGISSKNVNE